jgi:hypothetical protein
MSIVSLIPSFNAGELSPLIHLRSDLEKYRSGCRTLQNMLITPYGGVRRRAGLSYTATAPGVSRLFRFQASIASGYVLEMSAGKLRFYFRDGLVMDGADPYEVESPYAIDHLWGVQMAQINNVAYLAHPLYPVHKLARISHNEWELLPVDFSYPAMLEQNLIRSQKMTTSAAGEVGANITITSSFSFFTEGHRGGYLELSHERAANQFEVSLAATSGNNGHVSSTLIVQGAWNITTRGTWTGTFQIQRNSGSGWETIRNFTSSADANYSAGGEEPDRVQMRLKWNHGADGSSNPKAVLEASGAFITGLVKLTDIASSSEARAVVVNPVQSGSTSYWREGAWSTERGFPRTVAAHEQRLVFGGNAYRPQTVWGSAVDDYEKFQPGVEDADSWSHTIVSGQQNDIQWLISQKSLLIGTSGDEWVISSNKQESTITPTNVRARRHSGNGSDYLKPQLLDSSVLFVQRGGKVLREMSYNFEADGYVTSDLTLLAEHITGQGIIDTAYQTQPESILWCVTKGGDLIALTYDKAQNISGWHRHVTGNPASDGFESVAVKSVEGEADQLWAVVRRTINGQVVRYVERFKPDGFFLDQPWDLLFPDTFGVAVWSYLYVSYAELVPVKNFTDWVVDVDDVVIPSEPFTTDASSPDMLASSFVYPPDGGLFATTVSAWEFAATNVTYEYHPGNCAYRSSGIYVCILDHAIGDGTVTGPGTGTSWTDYWELLAPMASPILYRAADTYAEGDIVSREGRTYTALVDHTPEASNVPGEGISWASYWDGPAQGGYHVSDLVSSNGKNYICTADHVPTEATRPESGADWGDVWEPLATDNLIFFVDSGVTLINPGEISQMTGLDHLEGETVQVVANGAVLPSRVVAGGAIQFDQEGDPTEFTNVCAGLSFESILEPMALEVGMQNGTSVSREKRIHELVIYFKDSYGCKVSDRLNGQFDAIRFYDTGDINAPSLFTGPMLHKLDSRHELDASFVLKQDLPMPFKVLAVVPKFNVFGDNQ